MAKSSSIKKVLSPKAWYLLAAGGVALAADGTRRLLRRRRKESQTTVTQMERGEAIPVIDERLPAETPRQAAPVATATPTAKPTKRANAAKAVAPDDLTAIKGIGPVFAKRLNEAGITTYADLAAAAADHLREMTNATATADPEEWIAQARAMGQ